jgi:hypothetical protein
MPAEPVLPREMKSLDAAVAQRQPPQPAAKATLATGGVLLLLLR